MKGVQGPYRDRALAVRTGRGYDQGVQDHLDLQGASGATYRFRLVSDLEELPATSGNFVYLRREGAAPRVFCFGAVDSLGFAAERREEIARAYGPADLYVRLNVARALRDEEHADLVRRHRPPMDVQA